MIRVNLLPGKREKARTTGGSVEGGQAWLVLLFGAIVIELIILFFVHRSMESRLSEIVGESGRLQASIDKIKGETADHPAIKAQLADLRDREGAIAKLQGARSGPTSTLLELGKLLTAGRGPTTDRDKLEQLKRDKPGSVPNPTWDPRRVWITKYSEQDRVVKIEGLARDGEDVAEFERRLDISDFFYEVKPPSAVDKIDDVSKVSLKQFTISAKVRY